MKRVTKTFIFHVPPADNNRQIFHNDLFISTIPHLFPHFMLRNTSHRLPPPPTAPPPHLLHQTQSISAGAAADSDAIYRHHIAVCHGASAAAGFSGILRDSPGFSETSPALPNQPDIQLEQSWKNKWKYDCFYH